MYIDAVDYFVVGIFVSVGELFKLGMLHESIMHQCIKEVVNLHVYYFYLCLYGLCVCVCMCVCVRVYIRAYVCE